MHTIAVTQQKPRFLRVGEENNKAERQPRFSEWKTGDEYGSYFFGKDGLGLFTQVLRHVHLVPLNDLHALRKWNTAWRRSPPGRKTSDRYLFYCDGGRFGYLLIAIIGDPGAHEFLRTPDTRDLLDSIEVHAQEFVDSGTISI